MSRKSPISDADKALFREKVKGTRRLKQDKVPPTPSRPAPLPRQTLADERRVLDDMFSDQVEMSEFETGEEILFARPGLQHGVLRKLRRGQFAIGAELDLHGQTASEARISLTEFIKTCRVRDIRCVRIIHGKGHRSFNKLPVLKNKVATWLRQRDEVLAYCSARPVDGGTGAVYVVLKRG